MHQQVNFAFLHGGGQGGWVWQDTIEALNHQAGVAFARALALDVPGCGAKRGRHTDGIGLADIASELIHDLEADGMRDVILVGHSQAGCVLPAMIESRPDLFRRVVYVTCSIPLPGQTVEAMMGTGRHGTDPDQVGWPVDRKSVGIEQMYSSMFCNDMSAGDAAAFLGRLGQDAWPAQSYQHVDWHYTNLDGVPATYVVCLADGILPVAWQQKFAERFHAKRLVRIDAGHQAMNTRPQALAEILRNEALLP
jgi:pimeloyl-ACP methyl ester carboxylesterase